MTTSFVSRTALSRRLNLSLRGLTPAMPGSFVRRIDIHVHGGMGVDVMDAPPMRWTFGSS